MTLYEELYCRNVERKVIAHLFRCSIDDTTLAVQNLGSAFAGVLGPIGNLFNGGKHE